MNLRVEMVRMQNQLHNVILFVFLLVSTTVKTSLARVADIQFGRISIESGLSQSSVLCIYQDSKDFLWFGTYEGLNRYDGYDFKVYKSDSENPYSDELPLCEARTINRLLYRPWDR